MAWNGPCPRPRRITPLKQRQLLNELGQAGVKWQGVGHRMNHPVSKRKNLRTGLLLALVAIAVFAYTIWAVMHHKL